jgi:undecaprenyl-diphosphatase
MSYLDAVLLGAVEGITEFLPISSTGHLIVTAKLLGLEATEFLKSFSIAIQLGAVLAVVVAHGMTLARDRRLLGRVLAAFVPTALIGLLLYEQVRSLLGSVEVVLWAFALGGILLIVLERLIPEPADASEDLSLLPYSKAVLIGTVQSLALIPGVSRAAATVMAGLSLGLSRRAIVEFSFLLAIPTLGAATLLDLAKNADTFSGSQWPLLAVGFLAAFFTALLTVRWLLRFIRTHDFTPFGVYRIVAAVLLAVFLM